METEKFVRRKLEPIHTRFLNKTSDYLNQLVEKKKLKSEFEKIVKKRLAKISLTNMKAVGVAEIGPKVVVDTGKNNSETVKDGLMETASTVSRVKEKKKKKKRADKVKGMKGNRSEVKVVKFKNCDTLEDWKRKSGVAPETKVFICCPGYPDMWKGLLERGYFENNDISSPFFDIKITMSSKGIDFENLTKGQIVNHFTKMGEYTRKVMLAKNLKNLVWIKNIDIDSFFPRVYDLTDKVDVESFIEDFKFTKIEGILKEYTSDNNGTFDQSVIKICISILERRLKSLDEIIDSNYFKLISQKEWELISGETDDSDGIERSRTVSKKSSVRLPSINRANNNIDTNDYKEKAKELLGRLKSISPQFNINGNKNIWIMKPSGLSRGRGIKCTNSLSEVVHQVKSGCNQYIIQKYIENPMIVLKRKFDIRQWVLVTDFNPLTIWLYETPYIRFSAEAYNPDNIHNLYSHLTNNAIAKGSSLFQCSEIAGNMWDIKQFSEFLKGAGTGDPWKEVIQKKIVNIVINSLESAAGNVENRKNTHEVFGFDVMVDEDLNVWLLEINSSPCMEYSTEITKRLVKQVMEDTLKVVIEGGSDKEGTGNWKLIHKGKYIDQGHNPPGLNLVLNGEKIYDFEGV
jgi:tubulin monoglycylase TTLL3/8